ncbi:MAG: flavodoxin family protein [Bacillota bacterium]|jgi:flavodoxin
MNALVVYDSVFGNTKRIAFAIANALTEKVDDVETLDVRMVRPDRVCDVDILIVGSPTRGFRPTGDTVEFLNAIPDKALTGIKVAAFDTRISEQDVKSCLLPAMMKLFGYAARPIGKRLVAKGGHLAVAPEGFFVQASEGPLKEGELERAAGWAKKILN